MNPPGVSVLRFYRPFLPMFGGIFLCLLGVGASLATLPFFVLHQHGSKFEAGVAVAALSVAVVIGRPIAGRLADQHGYKLLMLCGATACTLAGVAYYGAVNMPVLVLVRILHGAGEAAVYTAGATWLIGMCPAERRGRVVGLYGICMWLGITLGALFGTLAMRGISFNAVWGLCVLVGLAGFASISAGARPARAEASQVRKLVVLPVSTVMPGVALSLASLGYAALAAFVALLMRGRGVADGIAAFNAFGFTYIGVRLFIGNVPDRLGPRRVSFWSALVEAAGLLIVAVAHNLVVVIIGGLVMGAGLSLLFPALALIVINRTDKSQQGAALGAFTSFWDLGIAVGAPVSGLIASLAGYVAIYYVMAGCAVASAALAMARWVPGHPTASPSGTVTSSAGRPG